MQVQKSRRNIGLWSVAVSLAAAFALGAPVLSSSALAAVNPHVSEAVEHAKGAASHGKQGHADACVQSGEEALKHAKAAGVKNPHVDMGVIHLMEAVQHGKAGHADACTEHAEGASTHLAEVLAEGTTSTGNRVFFRGGAAGMTSDRAGELVSGQGNDGTVGYYIGGGAEFMLSKDLWGMVPGVALVGEIGLEFKRWSSSPADGLANLGGPAKVQMTMLTASVAPKVKFRQGTDFQPWIIPAGLDFHVISPTSSQINYLDMGVQFGGGAEFRVWKELWLGLDSRFHLASNQTNTVNNFWTTGIYGAIGF
ncbi:MAG: small metal-binding protein SmbP [Nitrospira sp.]|nr:small metal-binding protein SmbP [Nitrospira sp.]MDH4249892.1 small metal-binding protein SmbP [Nitrospira sp.]MDH4343946.1 small metal-binding protein SmbP [Nitrospira sp.]MDH5336521.1 small metal-binding protein SmbP [Nitrospira sp.]